MGRFVVREYHIPLDRERFAGAGAVTVVLLSDLHGAVYGEGQRDLARAVREAAPDLIVGAGDLLTYGGSPSPALELLYSLAGLCPIFLANGNHETRERLDVGTAPVYAAYEKEAEGLGAVLLRNRKAALVVRGLPMEIAGLETGSASYRRLGAKKLQRAEMEAMLAPPDASRFSLLIAHNPMDFETYAAWGADLTVSGHLHGGYVRLPLLGGVISPQLRLFPKYDRGLFAKGKNTLAVSAGLGDHGPFFRLGNPRELVVLRLK